MGKRYVTVAEYAAMKGISKQAVYKSLSKRLDKFATTVNRDGKMTKVIDMQALSDFEKENPLYNSTATEEQQVEKQPETQDKLKIILEETIATLKQQLDVKDQQIAALATALAEAQGALTREQSLHAGTIQTQLLPEPVTGDQQAAAPVKRHWWSRWR